MLVIQDIFSPVQKVCKNEGAPIQYNSGNVPALKLGAASVSSDVVFGSWFSWTTAINFLHGCQETQHTRVTAFPCSMFTLTTGTLQLKKRGHVRNFAAHIMVAIIQAIISLTAKYIQFFFHIRLHFLHSCIQVSLYQC